jgi:hypothetical protein
MPGYVQNKKRKFAGERIGRDDRQSEEPDDKLKDAATLYVGNLYVFWLFCEEYALLTLRQVFLHDGGADS